MKKIDLSEKTIREKCPHCDTKSMAFAFPAAETKNFWIVFDAHSLVEGHLLIIPKGHYACIGTYPKKILNEFKQIYKYLSNFILKNYDNVSTFEHGIAGQTVFHSHIHLFPFGGSPLKIILEGKNKFKKIKNILNLIKIFKKDKKYLFFSINQNNWIVNLNLAAPRFFRDRFAKALGHPDRGSWKKMHFNDKVMGEVAKRNNRCLKKWKKYLISNPINLIK